MASYIKLQDHEKRKTRAYAEDIGKYYNMSVQIFEDEQYYICHDGRIVEVVNIRPAVYISITQKKMPGRTRL